MEYKLKYKAPQFSIDGIRCAICECYVPLPNKGICDKKECKDRLEEWVKPLNKKK